MPSSSDRRKSGNRRAVGRRYEDAAAQFLIQRGFEILDKNYQAGHKEIDLVVSKPGVIVFVEVKAARSNAFGHPAEWVSARKIRLLTQAAQVYLDEMKIVGRDIRFDVICFVKGELEYFPGAFEGVE
ncbi:MAG: YraN family protein [bacterium]|nr:YraN family protein [bacterium]